MTVRAAPWILACALALLAACGGDDARPAAAAAAPSAPPAGAPASDDLARVMAAGVVRIGVKADSPPFGVKIAGEYTGFDIDLSQALAKQMGIGQVVFVPVTSANRIIKLLNGEVDMVIATMSITRYREHKVDFAEKPYFQDGQALLVPKDSSIKSYLDLAGKSVGALQGSDSSYYMKQVAPDCSVVKFEDMNALMAALEAGKVDAATSDMLILLGLRKACTNPDQFRLAGRRFTTEPYGIAVRQNQSHWRNAISDAIQTLWEKGRYQAILDSWFGPGTEYEKTVNYAIEPYPH